MIAGWWRRKHKSKLGYTNCQLCNNRYCLFERICVCVCVHLPKLKPAAPRHLIRVSFKNGVTDCVGVHPSTLPSFSEDTLAWLSLHCLCPSLSVSHQCHLPSIWPLTPTVCFFLSSRHGQEGRSQANARVVQAGAGEKCPGPL